MSLITSLHSERWVVLLVINVFLLFVGCFLDPASALIMLTPLLAPVAARSASIRSISASSW